ncbi:phenylacetate--CoA ligase family protein [Thermopirellula anaerolimosa]
MDAAPIENLIWNSAETLPREELRALQLARLRECVRRVAEVPFYKQAFAQSGVDPDKIRDLADLRRLPFTTKSDLRDHYPLGFLAVERSRIVRYHGSSGTTGQPTFVAYTAQDRAMWGDLCARFLVAGGLRPHHTVQIAFGYGLFTGGFGLHYGVETVGAAVIPAASGNTRRQVLLLRDLRPEVLICTPSYALTIADELQSENVDPATLALRFGHFGGEPWTEAMRREIEKRLGITAFNNYGLSEAIGPGVSGECRLRCGMHIQEDHFLVECLDPETLEPVPPGSPGELVITTLTREAMPLLRYRTRDLTMLDDAPCPCGRTGVRMARIRGRTDDMLIIRGVNVFPSQIEEALLKVEGTTPHYQIEVDRPGRRDEVTVHVEVTADWFSDKMSEMQRLRDAIIAEIHTVTGLHMRVNLVGPRMLQRFEGKAARVVDRRKLLDD